MAFSPAPRILRFIEFVYLLLLALWLGGILVFGAVLAPALFRVLTSAQAASVVREVLPVLEVYGVVAGGLLLLAGLGAQRPSRARMALLGGMLALALVSASVVSPRMAALRQQAGDRISELPAGHPTRAAFGKLHGVSSLLMLGQLLLGLGALALPLHARRE